LFLEHKIGMELDGVITGVENFGLFVTGIELPAEGFIHISSLTDDYYRFDRTGHVIAGHRSGNSYRLGDAVRVAVAAVDVDARNLDFRLVGSGGANGKRVPKPGKSRGKFKLDKRSGDGKPKERAKLDRRSRKSASGQSKKISKRRR
jgi:ribonuclease R